MYPQFSILRFFISNIKNLITVCIFLSTLSLFSDDISTKESELNEIQRLLQEHKRTVEILEQQKSSALKDKNSKQRQLRQSQQRVRELTITERNLKQSLDLSKNLLNKVDKDISNTHKLCYEAFLLLTLADQSESKLNTKHNDSFVLSLILKNLLNENSKLIERKKIIAIEKEKNENEVNKTLKITRDEKVKLNNISSTMKQLESDIKSFEQQKQEFIKKSKELERNARALQDLIDLLKREAEKYKDIIHFAGQYVWPLDGKILTPFGPKKHERYEIVTMSNGVDIAAENDTPVRAFSGGEVVFSDWFTGAGKMIIIDHKNGFHTVYSYNNTLLVSKGDKVIVGQIIARSGKTGSAVQPSLHFEVRRNGIPVDPMQFK